MAAKWGRRKTCRGFVRRIRAVRARAVATERSRAVPGHGRDARRDRPRAAGRARHPHGGRPAGRAGAATGARRRPSRARPMAASPIPRRSASARSAPASPATTPTTHGLDVPLERIAVTTGSSAGFNLAFLAAFDHGDRIALAAPGYPAYRNLLQRARPGGRRHPGRRRHPLRAHAGDAGSRASPRSRLPACWSRARPIRAARVMRPAALGALIEAARRSRHPLHLRRDLPRPRL